MTGKKFVAVLNKKVEVGKVMNALAHCTAGLCGKYENTDDLGIINYEDGSQGVHWSSKHPFIILRAKNGNQIRTFREALKEKDILFASFNACMTVGGWEEQVERSKATPEEELEYYGVVTFGDAVDLDPLTKKFSLWT